VVVSRRSDDAAGLLIGLRHRVALDEVADRVQECTLRMASELPLLIHCNHGSAGSKTFVSKPTLQAAKKVKVVAAIGANLQNQS